MLELFIVCYFAKVKDCPKVTIFFIAHAFWCGSKTIRGLRKKEFFTRRKIVVFKHVNLENAPRSGDGHGDHVIA